MYSICVIYYLIILSMHLVYMLKVYRTHFSEIKIDITLL